MSAPTADGMAPPLPVALSQMISGYWITQSLHVAAKLGVADALAGGPRTVAEIAARCGADPRSLHRLLRGLASVGVFAQARDGRFEQTPLSDLLRADAPGSLRGLAIYHGDSEHYRAWGDLAYSVRTGGRAFDRVFGKPIFAYLPEHPEAAQTFDTAMTTYTNETARAIAAAYDFSRYGCIADIAGGAGTLLAEILTLTRGVAGLLFELPHVIERARPALAARGLADRCATAAGNFFDAVPDGCDLYILKWILHDWDDERALIILRNLRRALRPEARLLLFESVIQPGNDPAFGKLMDLNMLVMTGGCERTRAEFADLLGRAGFELTTVIPTHPLGDLIEARPA